MWFRKWCSKYSDFKSCKHGYDFTNVVCGIRVEHSLLERTQTSDTNTAGEDTEVLRTLPVFIFNMILQARVIQYLGLFALFILKGNFPTVVNVLSLKTKWGLFNKQTKKIHNVIFLAHNMVFPIKSIDLSLMSEIPSGLNDTDI